MRLVELRLSDRLRWGLLLSVLVLGAGCEESSVASLQGRWDGEIRCAKDTSTISISFEINGESIGGNAYTRTLGVTKEWRLSGRRIGCVRYARCPDDSCSSQAECKTKHISTPIDDITYGDEECPAEAEPGLGESSFCNPQGICQPCLEPRGYSRLLLPLADDNEQIPDPMLDVARAGEIRLEGTIRGFCPDEFLAEPQVVLTKEP